MFIPELQQHLQVASQEEAQVLTRVDKKFWNVISIYGTSTPRPLLPGALQVHYACFDDIESFRFGSDERPAGLDILSSAFRFADGLGRSPLLVHCRMGLSRSAALMLGWLCHRFQDEVDAPDKALEVLLRVRPQAVPNELVLRLGLQLIMPAARAEATARALVSHPRVQANRPTQ